MYPGFDQTTLLVGYRKKTNSTQSCTAAHPLGTGVVDFCTDVNKISAGIVTSELSTICDNLEAVTSTVSENCTNGNTVHVNLSDHLYFYPVNKPVIQASIGLEKVITNPLDQVEINQSIDLSQPGVIDLPRENYVMIDKSKKEDNLGDFSNNSAEFLNAGSFLINQVNLKNDDKNTYF